MAVECISEEETPHIIKEIQKHLVKYTKNSCDRMKKLFSNRKTDFSSIFLQTFTITVDNTRNNSSAYQSEEHRKTVQKKRESSSS